MLTPREIIGVALDQLTAELTPVVERELHVAYGPEWRQALRVESRNHLAIAPRFETGWDSLALLTTMWDHWNQAFRPHLSLFERSLVSELREFRNRWAHQSPLTEDDAYRVVDSVQRLLQATHAPEATLANLEQLKLDLLRSKLGRQVNSDRLRAQSNRERITEVALFVLAAVAVVMTTLLVMVPRNPLAGMILCLFTMVVFGYILRNRWSVPVPIHGVQECRRCRKVIYSEVCPYCEAPANSEPLHRAESHDLELAGGALR